ncbi:MAG: O-antigen ligase family protein [Thermodesulfobacteriota bacterium]
MNRLEPRTSPLDPHPAPWGIFLFFILLAGAVLVFHLPQLAAAWIAMAFFALITIRDPMNGVAFLVLTLPFFLGASHNPFFGLYELFIYGSLVLGFLNYWRKKQSLIIPQKSLILFLGLAALFSIPVNLGEYYYVVWATSFSDLWFQFKSGHEKFHLFHLRALANLFSGLLFFILTANLFQQQQETLKKILRTLVWTAALLCLVGLLFLYQVLPSLPKTYLSLSLAGTHEGAISVFAFNRQYLAQYLLLLFPFAFYFLFSNRRSRRRLIAYGLILVLLLFALTATMQRSAFLVLFLEMYLLVLASAWGSSFSRKRMLVLLSLPVLFLVLMVLVDSLFLSGRFLTRVSLWGLSDPDQRRWYLWNTAWNMFSAFPLLGTGPGKYSELFPEFFNQTAIRWKVFGAVRGEPHSFYLQVLAEQGLIGLFLHLSLAASVVFRLMKKIKMESSPENKMLRMVLLIALTAWLMMGFFHNLFYVRSLGLIFWVLLGWSVAMTDPPSPSSPAKWKTKIFWVVFFFLLAAFLGRVYGITQRPLSLTFRTGFYDPERLPDGIRVRWTGKRAVVNQALQNGETRLTFSAPIPGITEKPQKVRFRIGGKVTDIILKDKGWQTLTLTTGTPTTGHLPLTIETGYVFNPCRDKISGDNRNLGIMIRED